MNEIIEYLYIKRKKIEDLNKGFNKVKSEEVVILLKNIGNYLFTCLFIKQIITHLLLINHNHIYRFNEYSLHVTY